MSSFKKYSTAIFGAVLYVTLSPKVEVTNLSGTVCASFEIKDQNLSYFVDTFVEDESQVRLERFLDEFPAKIFATDGLVRLSREICTEYFVLKRTKGDDFFANDTIGLQIIGLKRPNLIVDWSNPELYDTGLLEVRLHLKIGADPFKFVPLGHQNDSIYVVLLFLRISKNIQVNGPGATLYNREIRLFNLELHKEHEIVFPAEAEMDREMNEPDGVGSNIPDYQNKVPVPIGSLKWPDLHPGFILERVLWCSYGMFQFKHRGNMLPWNTYFELPNSSDFHLSSQGISDTIENLSSTLLSYVMCTVTDCTQSICGFDIMLHKEELGGLLGLKNGPIPEYYFRPLCELISLYFKAGDNNIWSLVGYREDCIGNFELIKNGNRFAIVPKSDGVFRINSVHYSQWRNRFIIQVSDPHFGELFIHNIKGHEKWFTEEYLTEEYLRDILRQENSNPNLLGAELWGQTTLEELVEYLSGIHGKMVTQDFVLHKWIINFKSEISFRGERIYPKTLRMLNCSIDELRIARLNPCGVINFYPA